LPLGGAKPPSPSTPTKTGSRKTLPQSPRDTKHQDRLDIYRDKVTMLQADLASALARQKTVEDAAKEQEAAHANGLKALRQQHADALGVFETQLHALLAQRQEDAKLAAEREADKAKMKELEHGFADKMHSLTAASDKAVAAAQARAESMTRECEKQRAEIVRLRRQLAEETSREKKASGARVKKYEEELGKVSDSRSKLEGRLRKADAKIRTLEEKTEASSVEASKAKRALQIAEAQLAESGKQVSSTVEEYRRRAREQLREKDIACEGLEALVSTLKSRLAETESKTEHLQRRMEDETADRTSSHEQIVARYREQATAKDLQCVELQDQVDSLTAKLGRLDALNRDSKRREEDASTRLKAEIVTLKAELGAELDTKRAECAALTEDKAHHTALIEKLEKQAQMYRTASNDLENKLRCAEDDHAALATQITNQNTDSERLEARIRDLSSSLERTKRELTNAKNNNERMASEAVAAQDSAAAETRDRIQALEAALATAMSNSQLLQAKLSAAENELAQNEARGQQTETMSEEATKWKKIADQARTELVSMEHVIELKIKENKDIRVKMLEVESRLDEGRSDAAKTLSEIVRVQTQKEELVANLEAKRLAHEQAVVDNAHLKEDLKSLEEDMKTLSTENQKLKRKLENYRKDLEKSGIFDAFGTPPPASTGSRGTPSRVTPVHGDAVAASTPMRIGPAMFG